MPLSPLHSMFVESHLAFVRKAETQMMQPSSLWNHTRDLSLPHQQRKVRDLADSISQHGYDPSMADLPIHAVMDHPSGKPVISDGNNRLRAMEMAGYDKPIQVRTSSAPEIEYEHYQPGEDDGSPPAYAAEPDHHRIVAYEGTNPVGHLDLHTQHGTDEETNTQYHPGMVANLFVEPTHRRRGIARGMWDHAKSVGLNPSHSPILSPEGEEFSKHVSKTAFFVRTAALFHNPKILSQQDMFDRGADGHLSRRGASAGAKAQGAFFVRI